MAKAESIEKDAQQAASEVSKVADRAVKKAGEEAHTLLAELQPALDALTDRLHVLAEQSRDLAVDAGHQTRDSVLQARDRAGEHVADKPFQSLAIATAAGLVLGWLITRR